jgi:thymidylate synthase ThyX
MENVKLIRHNSIFDLGVIARVCYGKENKSFKKSNLLKFVSDVLLKHKHMSVFEHLWYHIKFENDFEKFVTNLFNELLNSHELNRFIQLFYFDQRNRILSLNLRTVLEFILDYEIQNLSTINQLINFIIDNDTELKSLLQYYNTGSLYCLTDDNYSLHRINTISLNNEFILYSGVEQDSTFISLINITRPAENSPYATYTFYLHNIPIYVRDHIIRHRFGVFTAKSLRYVKDIKFTISKRVNDTKIHKDTCKLCSMSYKELLERGDKPELARGVLPFHTSTSLFWTLPEISLQNFFKLRLDTHAQYETRIIAEAIKELIA